MRAHGWTTVLALALALLAATDSGAAEAVTEPATGGLTPAIGVAPAASATDAPVSPAAPAALAAEPAAAAKPTKPAKPAKRVDDTSWGLVARGGYFGLPDVIADKVLLQHPKIEGAMYGGEIRYHGEGGGRGVASFGLAVDSGSAKTDGFWQRKENDPPKSTSGEISLLAVTVTGYWSLFPSWYVHPYVGIGIGVAHLKGHYQNDKDRVELDYWIPAVHLPLGLAIELGPRLQLAAEARFIDGITANGAVQVRF